MVALVALASILAAPLNGFLLEAGTGGAMATDNYSGDLHAAPIVSLFAGREATDWVAGLGLLYAFGTPDTTSGNGNPPHNGGINATAVFLEAGVHTAGDSQIGLRAGAGFGHAYIQCDCSETPPLDGGWAPAFALTLEGRLRLNSHMLIGLQFGGALFTGLGHAAGSAYDVPGGPAAESSLVHPIAYLMFTLAYLGPGAPSGASAAIPSFPPPPPPPARIDPSTCDPLVPAVATKGAVVHTGPDRTADVVIILRSATPVCASAGPVGFGLRRIKSADGIDGYVEDQDLSP
jgi:hypothetical protein